MEVATGPGTRRRPAGIRASAPRSPGIRSVHPARRAARGPETHCARPAVSRAVQSRIDQQECSLMKLYYLTGACSLASYIALIEAHQEFEAISVDRATKRGADGKDYLTINPR